MDHQHGVGVGAGGQSADRRICLFQRLGGLDDQNGSSGPRPGSHPLQRFASWPYVADVLASDPEPSLNFAVTNTPFIRDLTQDVRDHFLAPFRGVGEPEDIAKVAVFLASDDASWITGVPLPVDGEYPPRHALVDVAEC